jgi:hypothetical protein
MFGLLKQPYVFALALAVVTAALMYLYARTIERDTDKCTKTFFKTLAISSVAGLALAYASSWGGGGGGGGGESGGGHGHGHEGGLATEPFMPER